MPGVAIQPEGRLSLLAHEAGLAGAEEAAWIRATN
jgi:hypothetical protein